jgi:hypothetical protein
MPAQSKAQQRFMGMVHAAQKGEEPASPEVAKVAKSMDDKDAKDFASTSHKGLPNRVKQEILNRLKNEYGLMLPGHNVKPAAPAQSLDDLEGVDESINEGLKHFIHVGTPKEIVSKDVAKQIITLAKKGVRSNEIGLNMHFVGNEKAAVDAFQKVKNKIYFELDTNENVNPDEINSSIIPAALKVRFERALELIQGKELSYNQKIKLLAMVIDSLGVDKAELSKISSKIKTNLD